MWTDWYDCLQCQILPITHTHTYTQRHKVKIYIQHCRKVWKRQFLVFPLSLCLPTFHFILYSSRDNSILGTDDLSVAGRREKCFSQQPTGNSILKHLSPTVQLLQAHGRRSRGHTNIPEGIQMWFHFLRLLQNVVISFELLNILFHIFGKNKKTKTHQFKQLHNRVFYHIG